MVEQLIRLHALIRRLQTSQIGLDQFCRESGLLVDDLDEAYPDPDETPLGDIWVDLELMIATAIDDPSYKVDYREVDRLASRMLKRVELLMPSDGPV